MLAVDSHTSSGVAPYSRTMIAQSQPQVNISFLRQIFSCADAVFLAEGAAELRHIGKARRRRRLADAVKPRIEQLLCVCELQSVDEGARRRTELPPEMRRKYSGVMVWG